jgi:HEAT repeat protein
MIRIGALQGLSAASGREAIPQLAGAMKESDARVQAAAIRFLNRIPGAEATAALLGDWEKLAPPGRARVVTALAGRGDRSAVPAIVKATKDGDEGVRTAALSALAMIGDAASVGQLAETAALPATTEPERTAARNALDRMRGADVDRAIVSGIGPATGQVKLELIRSAGERGIAGASDALLAAVRGGDDATKREAFRALRETAGDAQVPGLLELLTAAASESDRREGERALSAALRRSPASRSASVIEAYNDASRAPIKASLLQVMGQSGARDALPVLRAALNDPSPDLVRSAILALTEWPEAEPLGDLLSFAGRTQSPVHQTLALRGVLRLMDLPSQRSQAESVKILETAIKLAQQPDEKRGVLALLPRFPTKEALQIAEAAETDPSVANEAKAALQRLRRSVPAR